MSIAAFHYNRKFVSKYRLPGQNLKHPTQHVQF